MATITIPPDLEERLADEARRRGITTERLAVESLRRMFAADPSGGSARFREALDQFIGAVDGPADALSEDCGRRFADGLEERGRQGQP